MICIAGGMRYARETGRKFLLNWKKDPEHCPIEFNELFENQFPVTQKRSVWFLNHKHMMWMKNDEARELLATSNFMSFSQIFPAAYCNHRLTTAYAKLVRELIIRPNILSLADQILGGRKPVIGVHLRQGDRRIIGGAFPVKKFIEKLSALKAQLGGCLIYAASDSSDVFVELEKHFGADLIFFPERCVERNNELNVKHALAEMVILSKCPFFVVSPFSSMSYVTWLMGERLQMVGFPS